MDRIASYEFGGVKKMIQIKQGCQNCSGVGQVATTKWEEYIGNVYVISRCEVCKGSGRIE